LGGCGAAGTAATGGASIWVVPALASALGVTVVVLNVWLGAVVVGVVDGRVAVAVSIGAGGDLKKLLILGWLEGS
jgi:adenosine/AMP kinase